MRGHPARWAAAALAGALVVAVWAVVRTGDSPGSSSAFTTENYRPGLAADVYLPAAQPARTTPGAHVPVVVLIPGGAWLSADRTGLGPLATRLSEHGIVAVNATYRAANSGVRFPEPVADIVCAIDFAADRARRAGISAGPIIVLGHSSGAHLAALAALGGAHFRRGCPYAPVRVDGLIGLSGAYNVQLLQDLAYPLFGVRAADDPAVWRSGNPMNWADSRTAKPALSVLLAHGAADEILPRSFTVTFGQALEDAGHPVQVTIVPGATHATIYTPDVIAGTVITWTNGLSRT
jgi:acetyl esterase/lipase